jgi:two-component system, NarL family, sensor kinase
MEALQWLTIQRKQAGQEKIVNHSHFSHIHPEKHFLIFDFFFLNFIILIPMNRLIYQIVGVVFIASCIVATSNIAFAQIEHSNDKKRIIHGIWIIQRDSFLLQLQHNPIDTFQAHLLNQLSYVTHALGNFDSALIVAKQAHMLSRKINHIPSLIESLTTLGSLYGNFGNRDYEKSLSYLTEASRIAEENRLYELTHKTYSSVLNLYFYGGDFPSAMNLTTKGLALAERQSDVRKISGYNNLLGFIYLRQGQADLSKQYYQRYLNFSQSLNDSIAMADAHNCIAEASLLSRNLNEALRFHFIAWGIYYRHYIAGVNFKHDQIAYTAYRISHTYKLMKDYDQAVSYSTLGLNYTRKHGTNEYDLASYYLNAGELHKLTGNATHALQWGKRALALSIEMKHLENIRDSYLLTSEIYKELNVLDSAYNFHVLYARMKDSIVNETSHREIQHLQSRYDLQKKDQEIAMQQAELEQQEFQRNALMVAFLFLVVIMFLLYNRYRLKQQNKFQAELANQQNELFNTIVTFQDSERQRIAQDIHDSVGSVLSAAKLQLSALEYTKDNMPLESQKNYDAAIALIDQATQELRSISHNIMPAALSRLGLIAALRNLIEKISDYSGVQINFNVHGFSERLAEKTEIGIYPVVLELINNVLKHAHASEATIQLVRHPAYINITVEDNGKGFDVTTKSGRDGIGLKSVMSRIQYLKGTINIDSEIGQGTSIMIDIPY